MPETISCAAATATTSSTAATGTTSPWVRAGATWSSAARRNLLIGGRNGDRLVGGGDDDLLIAGFTAYDQDDAALNLVRAEWTSPHPYALRVNNISGVGNNPNKLNGDIFLIKGTTVQDDDARDVLTGSAGSDWFLYDPLLDMVADFTPGEKTN